MLLSVEIPLDWDNVDVNSYCSQTHIKYSPYRKWPTDCLPQLGWPFKRDELKAMFWGIVMEAETIEGILLLPHLPLDLKDNGNKNKSVRLWSVTTY